MRICFFFNLYKANRVKQEHTQFYPIEIESITASLIFFTSEYNILQKTLYSTLLLSYYVINALQTHYLHN
jgi:hypothetical protein